MENLDERIKKLPPLFIAPINAMQAGDFVACLHLIIDAGEHYSQFEHGDLLVQQINKLQSDNFQLMNELESLKSQFQFQKQKYEETIKDLQNFEPKSQDFQQIPQNSYVQMKQNLESASQTEQFFDDISYGELEDQSDLKHVAFLLLNQNYNLSNLLRQQFQSKQHFLLDIFDRFNAMDQRQLIKQLVTTLENFADLFTNQKTLERSFERIRNLQSQKQNESQQNNLMVQKLEFELELMRKKCKIQDLAVTNEDLTSDKYASQVVFYKALSQYYEGVLQTGVHEHVKYLQNSHIEKQVEEPQILIKILRQLSENQFNFKTVNSELNLLMQTIPSKINLKDSEFKQELKRILNQIVIGLQSDYKKVINEHQLLLQNNYLTEQNALLTQMVLQLATSQESDNNSGNLNQFIFCLQNKINYLNNVINENEAKIDQLATLNDKMKEKYQLNIQNVASKVELLSQSLDSQKMQKFEEIVIKQQRIINDQQEQLEHLHVTKVEKQTQKCDEEFDSVLLELEKSKLKHRESQNLNLELVAKYEQLQFQSQETIDKLNSNNIFQKQQHIKSLKAFIDQIQKLQVQKYEFKTQFIQEKLSMLSEKFKQVQNLLQKYTKLILYQKEIILQKSPTQEQNWQQTDLSSFDFVNKEQMTAITQLVTAETQFQPQTDEKQTQLDCQQCKKCIQLYILEKQEKQTLLEQVQDQTDNINQIKQLKTENDKFSNELKQIDLQEQNSQKQTTKLKKQIQNLEEERQTTQKSLNLLKEQNDILKNDLTSLKKLNKAQLKQIQNSINQRNEVENKFKQELEVERSKSAKLTNVIQVEKMEIQKYKEIVEETTKTQEELKELAIMQTKQIQKLKRQHKVKDEDRRLMSSILTNEDIDAIFDV